MRIIIEHSETKRVISGSFNIIGRKKDLLEIASHIQAQCKGDWVYGLIEINPHQQYTTAEPIKWDSESQTNKEGK